MPDKVAIGHGAAFKRGDGADPEVFANAGEIKDVILPKLSRDTIDKTHSQSPGGWREFMPGLRQVEEFSLEIHYDPKSTVMANVHADFGSDAPRNYQACAPDGSYFEFAALVVGIEPQTPTDGKMVCNVTFRPTGPAAVNVAGA